MTDSFVTYRSFHEALKDLPPEQYGKIMYAINEYALNQNEIELSGVEKIAFTLIKPQLDANLKRQENGKYGSLGGRPKKEPKNPMGYENKNPMGFEVSESENPNVNVNLNANENLNLNDEGEGEFKDCEISEKNESIQEKAENQPSPPSPPSKMSDSQKDYSRIVFEKFKNAGLPCQKGDFFRFQSCDFRLAIQKLKGVPSQDVISAVDNYIAELKNADSYIDKEFSFDTFVSSKTFSNCLPANYRPNNFKKFSKEIPKGAETEKPRLFKCDKCGRIAASWSEKLMKWHCSECGATFD